MIRNFTERYSINKLAKQLCLSPKGAHRIVKKLEQFDVLKAEAIGNALYYHADLSEGMGRKMAELVLTDKQLNAYSRAMEKDVQPLKPYTFCAVLFGSILTKGRNAQDIDILLVFEKTQFGKVYETLDELRSLKPKKIHEMVQSKKDLVNNIKIKNDPLLAVIRTGQVLWGSEIIVEAIRNATNQ